MTGSFFRARIGRAALLITLAATVGSTAPDASVPGAAAWAAPPVPAVAPVPGAAPVPAAAPVSPAVPIPAAAPAWAVAPSTGAVNAPPLVRPRLVVLITVDQLRADYLTRFQDLYLPPRSGTRAGGFRYVMEQGAYYTSAYHDHFPLLTGPGHAVLLTGAPPYKSGIVDNDWYDRALRRTRYCVEDPASPLVGAAAGKPGISPSSLRVTTVGDELKMATGGRAKVWGLALKDRAAVLMAGHLADGVLWFDDETGAWVSSRFYCHGGKLPAWVAAWDRHKPIDAEFGRTWMLSVPASALRRLWTPGNEHAANRFGLGQKFPHRINGGLSAPGQDFYRAFISSPSGNRYVLDTARDLIEKEEMGKDETPDLLAINLSTNDYVGHLYGPDSAEVLDVCVQTDRQLSDFFNVLDRDVPGGLASVTIVLTADHGVAPNAVAMREVGFNAGGYDESAIRQAAEAALDAAFGPADWTEPYDGTYLYLDLDTLADKKVPQDKAEAIAAGAIAHQKGIYAAYTRDQILRGWLPRTEIADRVARSFHPEVSGDVVIVADPHWTTAAYLEGATHGSPYVYDTKVPLLLAGAGIRPGRHAERVSTLDIAPTLAELLGILPPSGCEGRILAQALK